MSNGYFNGQTRAPLGKGGKGPDPGIPAAKGAPSFKEKPGFKGGLPGKASPDRSAGVTKTKVYPSSDGM